MATMRHEIKVNGVVVTINNIVNSTLYCDFHGYPIIVKVHESCVIVRNLQTGKFQSLPAKF